jgi:membrane fusion protein (multidrug efflux system)
VDSATRNVKVEATIANGDELLRPGMFVDVKVLLPTKARVLVIPSTSVLYAPYGDSVFVVDDAKDADGKPVKVARQQFVRLGEKRGDFVAVVSGLKAGEVVVTTGAFKLRNGLQVTIDNRLAPAASLTPQPENS